MVTVSPCAPLSIAWPFIVTCSSPSMAATSTKSPLRTSGRRVSEARRALNSGASAPAGPMRSAQLLTRSPGHYADWIRACKGGDHACSNFSVAAPFVQWMQLGVIAMKFEGKLEWDAAKKQFSNNSAANQHLKPNFRKGWKLA